MTPSRGYEFFEHTADVGAVVRGATLPRLFENAARAMFDLICDLRTVRPRRAVRIVVRGESLEDLLVRWLSELLFRLETQGLLFTSFAVEDLHSEYKRLRSAGVHFAQPPVDMGPVTTAVLDDTCGNLIQIAQKE